MIILGIDPGLANTGYGLIKKLKVFKCLDYGVIKTSQNSNRGERLRKINNELSKIAKKYRPDILAIENVYFFKNLKTAIPVSQVEGVILLMATKKRLPIWEATPLQVKLAITGDGKADKIVVQKKIKKLLSLKKIPKPDDAADALAIALTCFLKKT